MIGVGDPHDPLEPLDPRAASALPKEVSNNFIYWILSYYLSGLRGSRGSSGSVKTTRTNEVRAMNDDWLPAFAKLVPRREPEEDDPLQLSPTAMSLEGLQAVYRNPNLPLQMRIRAMIAALPFETPKLAVTATVSEHDFATLLDRRLKRIEEMKAKEIDGTPQVEAKPALPRLADLY